MPMLRAIRNGEEVPASELVGEARRKMEAILSRLETLLPDEMTELNAMYLRWKAGQE